MNEKDYEQQRRQPPRGGQRPPKRPSQKRNSGKSPLFRAFLVTLAVVLFCFFLAFFMLQTAGDLMGLDIGVFGLGQEDRQVAVDIPEGSSTGDIARILKKEGVIDSTLPFKLYAGLKKGDGEFQFGEYVMNCNMSYEQILIALKAGSDRLDVVTITFQEGLTLWEIGKKLEENEVCTAQEFAEALEKARYGEDYPYEFLKSIPGDEPLRFYRYEGYVFPDTYDFFVDENPTSVVGKFFRAFNSRFAAEYYDRMDQMGLTLDETITLASIIQKEASLPEDMKAVSGVFHNRFAKPDVYPQMQSDVTIFYVEQSIKPHQQSLDQPMYDAYNTYKCVGLPVGPICNPGVEAIEAALYPDASDYYYFLTDKNGDFYYAATLEEHEQNIYTASKVGGVGGIAID